MASVELIKLVCVVCAGNSLKQWLNEEEFGEPEKIGPRNLKKNRVFCAVVEAPENIKNYLNRNVGHAASMHVRRKRHMRGVCLFLRSPKLSPARARSNAFERALRESDHQFHFLLSAVAFSFEIDVDKSYIAISDFDSALEALVGAWGGLLKVAAFLESFR